MTKIKSYICQECGEPCEFQIVDFGIGPYEYWGAKGNDVNKQWVSDCCEATVLDPDTGKEADPPEPEWEPPENDDF